MRRDTRSIHEKRANLNPWKRKRNEIWYGGGLTIAVNSLDESFDDFTDENIDLDLSTKLATLKIASSVVSFVTLKDEEVFMAGSGTIVECIKSNNGYYTSIILTSRSLFGSDNPNDFKINVYVSDGSLFQGHVMGSDAHFNIAIIAIESSEPLPTAVMKLLDDSMSVIIDDFYPPKDRGVIRPHSTRFQIFPGCKVIAVGRYLKKPHNIMAAPGSFRLNSCDDFHCKELFKTTCRISKCGIGGPLVNEYGEVIGMNFIHELYTPFLPSNIVSRCLDYFRKNKRFTRPWIGMEATNLYAAPIGTMEQILQQFPDNAKGVLVQKVIPGSPAYDAGILPGDIIVQCNGKSVKSCLELFGFILGNTAEIVEVHVMRETIGGGLDLTLKVSETKRKKLNRWPLPKEYIKNVNVLRAK